MSPELFRTRDLALASCALLLCVLASPTAGAQVLFAYDGGAGATWELPSAPGAPCGQPTNAPFPWPHVGLIAPCAVPPVPLLPTLPAPGGILGDVASNRLTDTVFVTDGFTIGEFTAGTPFTAPPGTLINAFPIHAAFGLGPITGMCHDSGGVIAGAPLLFITDGFAMVGIAPSAPGTCGPPVLVTIPVPVPTLAGLATDITIDPFTATFWACDVGGAITNFTAGGLFLGAFPGAMICGPGLPLQGIAYDLASPGAPFIGAAPAPSLYVTDGFAVAYVSLAPFGPGAPTFYTPGPCSPTPGPITGLAYKTGAVDYGVPGPTFLPPIGLVSRGQASSPGPTHALGIAGTVPTSAVWVAYGFNIFAPGFFCPPVFPFFGVPLYVDIFTAPGGALFIGPGGPGLALPAAIPAGVPPGLEIHIQIFEDTSAAGLGPWKSSNAIAVAVSAP